MPAQPNRKPAKPQSFQPRFFKWRNAAPRWEPSPKFRQLGWKGYDFRDLATGAWLAKGAACDLADAINAAVDGWMRGEPIPEWLAKIAPDGAHAQTAPAPESFSAGALSIGNLLDDYLADPKPYKDVLSDATRRQYRSCMKVLIETVAAGLKMTVAELRRQDIAVLHLPATPGARFHLLDAYDLIYARSPSMAYATLTIATGWFNWMRRKRSIRDPNPCLDIPKVPIPGRIVTLEQNEIDALDDVFAWLGVPSLGDMVVLGVDLTWEQQSLISLTWDQLDDEFYVAGSREKTGISGIPRLSKRGIARIEAIRQRWIDAGGAPDDLHDKHVFLCELPSRRERCKHGSQTCLPCIGHPWKGDTLRQYFELAREIASSTPGLPRQHVRLADGTRVGYPAILDKQFRDLRDTGITRCAEAGMTNSEIATRSRHSEVSIAKIIGSHYVEKNQRMADSATDKLDALHDGEHGQEAAKRAKLRTRAAKLRLVS
jgi:hypothetical protein